MLTDLLAQIGLPYLTVFVIILFVVASRRDIMDIQTREDERDVREINLAVDLHAKDIIGIERLKEIIDQVHDSDSRSTGPLTKLLEGLI